MKQPKNETVWLSVMDINENQFYITSKNNDRSMYFIYDSNWKKLGKDANPLNLELKYVKGE